MDNRKILFISNQMDTPLNQISGTYNIARLINLHKLGYEIEIICPINLFPPSKLYTKKISIKKIIRYIIDHFYIPKKWKVSNFTIYYPKYISVPKKVSWYLELFFLHLFCNNKIKNIIFSYDPDIIITSWIHPFATYAKYIKNYFKGPIFSYCEGSDVLIFPEKYSGWPRIQAILNKHVDRIILISNEMEKQVRKKRNLINTSLIIDGYREDIFHFQNEPDKSDIKRILSVGALLPVKGHDILINSIPKINFNIFTTIIGDGEQKHNLSKLVRKNNLQNNFKFIPYIMQQDLANIISKCDIFCMPSRSDALPAAALEAMACGRPVVACAVGGLKDIIIDGFNGFLSEPEDSISLAHSIEKALNYDWNYKEISISTRKKYGWKKSIGQLHKIITNYK